MMSKATSERNTATAQAYPDSRASHNRLRELTAILATGVHRLRETPTALPSVLEFPAESSQTSLDPGPCPGPDGTVLTTRDGGSNDTN